MVRADLSSNGRCKPANADQVDRVELPGPEPPVDPIALGAFATAPTR